MANTARVKSRFPARQSTNLGLRTLSDQTQPMGTQPRYANCCKCDVIAVYVTQANEKPIGIFIPNRALILRLRGSRRQAFSRFSVAGH